MITTKTEKFYWIMVLTMIGFFLNAIRQTNRSMDVETQADYQHYETLSYQECVAREDALRLEMTINTGPKIPDQPATYYLKMEHAYGLIGSAKKLMYGLGAKYNPQVDAPYADRVRDIPILVQQMVDNYANGHFPNFHNDVDFKKSLDDFAASGMDPLRMPTVDTGINVALNWFYFHLAGMAFVFIHFAIRLRKQGCSIWMEVCANPQFPIWVSLWEVGIFRYPHKVSPIAQLRKAQQWAALILGSALSCFGTGAGKVCKEKENAPQHQRYDRVLNRLSFATGVSDQYLGMDGAIFHPAPVSQSSGTVSLPCHLYFNLWTSQPLGNRGASPNFGREFDYTLGWTKAIRGISIDANSFYINVSPQDRIPRGDVLQIGLRIGRTIPIGRGFVWEPHILMRESFPVRGPTPKGGFLTWSGFTILHPISPHTIASLTTEAFRDPGAFGENPGWLGRVVFSLNQKTLHGGLLQLPIVTYMDPLEHTGDGRHAQVAVGANFSFSLAHSH